MRPTMRLRVWFWRKGIDGILAGRSIRRVLWACRLLDVWDTYLNLCSHGKTSKR
jgi:hypothetical protein